MTTTPALVTGVDFVSLPTQDIDRAIAFYTETLGLERSATWQRPGQPAIGVEFETGTVTIALIASEMLGIPFQANKVPVALHVDDVHAARTQLESEGVTFFADTIDSGVCHMANFADPDGNALMFHHRYAPKA
jgi:predicted enzyme related to lactoylglutathione lyase